MEVGGSRENLLKPQQQETATVCTHLPWYTVRTHTSFPSDSLPGTVTAMAQSLRSLICLLFFFLSLLCFQNISSLSIDITKPSTFSQQTAEDRQKSQGSNPSSRSSSIDQNLLRKQQEIVVNAALHSISTDDCDWRISPLLYLKGKACGKYYKILNLKTRTVNQTTIRRHYHQMSKLLHPDKNPTALSTDTFRILTESYKCLMSYDCKESYDLRLRALEAQTFALRTKKLFDLKFTFQKIFFWTHHYLSIAANVIDQGNRLSSLFNKLMYLSVSVSLCLCLSLSLCPSLPLSLSPLSFRCYVNVASCWHCDCLTISDWSNSLLLFVLLFPKKTLPHSAGIKGTCFHQHCDR
jgi:hypothetical protein